MSTTNVDMLNLRQALESSWKPDTAHLNVKEKGNSALGQCYPSSRVVQYFLPESEIVEGRVLTHAGIEKHFWNAIKVNGILIYIDLTWQQFPPNSTVEFREIRDRANLNDSKQTTARIDLLLDRVKRYLSRI